MIATRSRSVRHQGRGVQPPRGFTLIELMVAIMVLSILLGIAVPSFRDAALGSRLTGYANDLVAGVQIARSEAIKRNAPVMLCASEDGETCGTDAGWEVGWIVAAAPRDEPRLDADGNPVLDDDGEPIIDTLFDVLLQRQAPLAGEFRVSAAGGLEALVFQPTVVGVTPASFTVCRASPVGKQERVVTVTASGQTSVTRTTAGACPGG
jgi:type IV fimbrial biogenesis protein FimT